LATPRPPSATRFPYTTLFRSPPEGAACGARADDGGARPEIWRECPLKAAKALNLSAGDRAGRCGRILPQLHDRQESRNRINRTEDRKSTRLNSSHVKISYAVF